MSRHAWLLGVVLTLSGCWVENDMFEEMEASQRAADERASRELVAFMSLKTMFPDPQVRALARAAGRGRVGQIDKLVGEGVDPNARGTRNATPLFWAMRSVKGFRRLLEHGADPNIVYDDGGTVMHWAVLHENGEFLRLALEHGGDPNLVGGIDKRTPLFDAVGPGNHDRIPVLLEAGADMDFQRGYGDTPMMDAASNGQFDVVHDLLERGADYHLRNYGGRTLMTRIAFLRRTMDPESDGFRWMLRVIDWLAEQGVEIPEWHQGPTRFWLLRYGALDAMFTDMRVRDLARAAGDGRTGEIDRLVGEGVNPNARGTHGATPLLWAIRSGSVRGFRRLLELGADPNIVFDGGDSVMHRAVSDESDEYLKLALEHGGDPNLLNPVNHWAPLRVAAFRESTGKIPILAEAGADLDHPTQHGETPMILLAQQHQYDAVYYLLERGADYELETFYSKETLMTRIPFSRRNLDPESDMYPWMLKVVEWLEERGVEIPEH